MPSSYSVITGDEVKALRFFYLPLVGILLTVFCSCTLTEVSQSADCKMMVSAVGESSQWGKIRANLVTEPMETPLQLKLDNMAKLIG